MKINSPQRNKAFTLVETLVAISIFTMSLLGTMSVLGSSIANTNYAKQKMVASYLAQEGIEYARNIRDTGVISAGGQAGWNTFTASPLPKLISCPVSTCPVSSFDFSGFTRTITMSSVSGSADEVKISSKVEWNQGSGTYNVTFSENLFNWIE